MASNENGILEIFAASDRAGETAAPEDGFDETAGPDGDDETAAAELDADDADTGDILALKKRGRKMISLEEARTLQARTRGRAKANVMRTVQPSPPAVKPPPNLVLPNDSAVKLMSKWRGVPEDFIVRQDGHYYGVIEFRCICEGNDKFAVLRIPGNRDYQTFRVAVGEDLTIMGNPSKMTANMTNLQRPSKNTYTNQDFLIKSVTMQEAGLRVKYPSAEVEKIMAISEMKKMLNGEQWLWDDSGMFLPKEIFHDVTGENLLYRALRRSAVLYFSWDQQRTGGNGTLKRTLIDHLRNVPDTKEKSMSRTSGGAPVLSVLDGYMFSDNPEHYGDFYVSVRVDEDIVLPVRPVDIGGGVPLKPVEVGLYVQVSLNGISFEPKKKTTN